MCGEHPVEETVEATLSGSSPHVRGTLGWSRAKRRHHGIIPACAGNTVNPCRNSRVPRDHPRMCGEHPPIIGHGKAERGSSPHVRGTRLRLFFMFQNIGIIPACAGNTYTHLSKQVIDRDHPRMCGEHAAANKRHDVV